MGFLRICFSSLVLDHDVKKEGASRVTIVLQEGTTSLSFVVKED